jgi:hypothetical protein
MQWSVIANAVPAANRVLRFLGWKDRKPEDVWPFPFGAFGPPPRPPYNPYPRSDAGQNIVTVHENIQSGKPNVRP